MARFSTVDELKAVHPDYERFSNDWEFYINSYYGGSFYKDGDYLLQHPFESETNYTRRKSISYFYNYCSPVIDIYTSHLFRKEPQRDFGSLTNDPLFENFLGDADLEGNTFNQFMRDAQRFASIYGRVSIIVDMPAVETVTQAENEEFDIRPYVRMVTPENVWDWEFVRLSNGRRVLDSVKIKEGNNFRVWDRFGWELWTVVVEDDETSRAILLDEGEHNLGVVPIVNLFNRRAAIPMIGLSDITDIADINKNIYYLCSDAKEIIENTAFPMLAMPYQRSGDEGANISTGPKNILQFDPTEANAKPYWLEAPHSSLSEIREWIKQDINEIFRIAKLGGVKGTEDFSQPRSGVALQLEQEQLMTTLSEKADNLEHAENLVLDLWALWLDKDFDGMVDYPDEFSIKDLDSELNRAIISLSARVNSETFDKERQKLIASDVLTKADDETKKKINDEIEQGSILGTETPDINERLGIEETEQ
jgi:hypothetical protein